MRKQLLMSQRQWELLKLEEISEMLVMKMEYILYFLNVSISKYGVIQGIMYMLLLSLSAHLTKELGMAPGGEFRRAFQEVIIILI